MLCVRSLSYSPARHSYCVPIWVNSVRYFVEAAALRQITNTPTLSHCFRKTKKLSRPLGYIACRQQHLFEQTIRLDLDVPGEFVDSVWHTVKDSPQGSSRTTCGDSFSGYLIAQLQGSLTKPVDYIHQLVTVRGPSPFSISTPKLMRT